MVFQIGCKSDGPSRVGRHGDDGSITLFCETGEEGREAAASHSGQMESLTLNGMGDRGL